jgi:hypothetical protein
MWVTHRYAKNIKRHEATIEFTKRFQGLLKNRHDVNSEFYFENGDIRTPPITVSDQQEMEAWNIFTQAFDLFLNEFSYFRGGVITTEVFTEWMLWRWYDWEPGRAHSSSTRRPGGLPMLGLETMGISYRRGWEWWKERPVVLGTPFVRFMDELHGAPNETAAKQVVLNWKPRRLRQRRPN